MTDLTDLPDGARARVDSVSGEPLLRERLVELGFTAGAEVEVKGRALLGDPIEVRVADIRRWEGKVELAPA